MVLDRDGVINHDRPGGILHVDHWQPLAGSIEAIVRLHQAGCKVAVATNQSAIGRGRMDHARLQRIHRCLTDEVSRRGGHIDLIRYCPHSPDQDCRCRKPLPGLILQVCEHLQTAPCHGVMVGDSGRDLAAAAAAGMGWILVRTGNGRATEAALPAVGQSPQVVDDLAAAVSVIQHLP